MHRQKLAVLGGNAIKRSQGRLGVRLAAKLKSRSRTQTAILENISKSGAKLAISDAPEVGADVIVQWQANEAFGRVTWVSATHCGISFASAVPPQILEHTLSLDEIAHVPDELNVDEVAAREWFDGNGRFGFD